MTTNMNTQVMQQARDALTPLANAHFPIEREQLSDDDVSQAGLAIAALEAVIAAHEIAALKAAQPVQRSIEYRHFLSDVMTAAGLVTHGKQCKALGERLGTFVSKEFQASAAQPVEQEREGFCKTCGGTKVDPGGLSSCRACMPQPVQPAADQEINWGEIAEPGLDNYFKANAEKLATGHPARLVRQLASRLHLAQTALAQPAPAAPYQVTAEDVQVVLDIYWAPGNSTVNSETMRRALEVYEARKATT